MFKKKYSIRFETFKKINRVIRYALTSLIVLQISYVYKIQFANDSIILKIIICNYVKYKLFIITAIRNTQSLSYIIFKYI